MALHSTGRFRVYDDAYAAAVDSLDSGKAYHALQKLVEIQ
jgi:anthranilate phosphoribosyltransferase